MQKWFYSVELTLIKQTIPKFKVLVYFSLFSYELIWYNLIYMVMWMSFFRHNLETPFTGHGIVKLNRLFE